MKVDQGPQGRIARVDSTRRVLVIGGASETGTVLKAVLEPRGATVEQARFRHVASSGAVESSPEIVVIDVDSEPDAASSQSQWIECRRVLIGSDQPEKIQSTERFLSKPFHYPELVQVIEDLLNHRAA